MNIHHIFQEVEWAINAVDILRQSIASNTVKKGQFEKALGESMAVDRRQKVHD